MLLWTMPANPEDTADQATTYMSIAIYIVGLTLTGPVIYYMRDGPRDGPRRNEAQDASETAASEDSETGDYVSDIEREFRALEMEIDRENRE